MAFVAVLEADLRALSAEARRKYPMVKDAAEHAILKLRSHSDPGQLAKSEDILRTFLLACEPKNVKLSALGLACLQKLIAHDAVSASALPPILATLKEHSDMSDENVQLKILQTILTILQSQLHPQDEDNMAVLLGICLRLLGNNRSADSVHSTAAATLRQAVALIFDRVVVAENLPVHKAEVRSRSARSISVSGDVSRNMMTLKSMEGSLTDESSTQNLRYNLTKAGKLGLRLLDDLTSLAGGGTANWLHLSCLQRTFALDMLEYVLSHYVPVFKQLGPYQQILRGQVCSLLMTSMRTSRELDSDECEPAYRRLVLKTVASVTRLYSSIVTTECEVFLSMLVKSADLELPLWHRIMVLEVLRGFCVEARMLYLLFRTFDMKPENTNLVTDLVQGLENVVSSLQDQDVGEESLAAVAAMFDSKAKGVEWTMDNEASGAAVMIASEAHVITLAVEGLLGVVFTVATLTDEAMEAGELESPRSEGAVAVVNSSTGSRKGVELAPTCLGLVTAVWHTLLDSLSLMLARSQGEAIVLEILKGYQAFTQSCGVLGAVEARDAFLASLCKFALAQRGEQEKFSSSALLPGGKRMDQGADPREGVVLTVKNVQALRTLFNISHRLNCVLDTSWSMVLETLAVVDRIIHSPHATTQEVATTFGSRGSEGRQASDFRILSSLDAQLFESSAQMPTSAVCSLLAALRQVSNNSLATSIGGFGSGAPGSSGGMNSIIGGAMVPKVFGVDRMLTALTFNLYRVDQLWDQVSEHFVELTLHESPQVRSVALDALDKSICTVLECDRIRIDAADVVVSSAKNTLDKNHEEFGQFVSTESANAKVRPGIRRKSKLSYIQEGNFQLDAFECAVIKPLGTLYNYGQTAELRSGALKILLHVLERHAEKLYHSWPSILELLRSVANTSEKDIVPLGFQNVRVIMNDGLLSIPTHALDMCVEVAGAYGAQKTDVNISLTAVGLLWTVADFCARGVDHGLFDGGEVKSGHSLAESNSAQPSTRPQILVVLGPGSGRADTEAGKDSPSTSLAMRVDMDCDVLLLAVYGVIQGLGTDERPEVRNSAIRTLFQSISSHGVKLSRPMWKHCLWNIVFPLVETVRHLAAISSKDTIDEELGMQGGKTVHMLVHHSRNTAQKQWDETLVLLLGGLSRLIKPYFQFFQSIENFEEGWEVLLTFMQESVVSGSKEVGLAAITSLHNILLSPVSKGCLPSFYFNTAFETYERIVNHTRTKDNRVATKARQELLQNLGELYSQGFSMFESKTYQRLLVMFDVFVRFPTTTGENSPAPGILLPLHRTTLEVLPSLKPVHGELLSMWPLFLRLTLSYLPGEENWIGEHSMLLSIEQSRNQSEVATSVGLLMNGHGVAQSVHANHNDPHSIHSSVKDTNVTGSSLSSTEFSALPLIFCERFISTVIDLYHLAPAASRAIVLPHLIAALGRSLATRRDYPSDLLWRTAVGSFNAIVQESLIPDAYDACRVHPGMKDHDSEGSGRLKFWKELADVFDNFLVGACGRASTVAGDDSTSVEADELLEASVLDVLCQKVLNSCQDAPSEVVSRLVDIIDRCAARTSLLPIPSVSLLPVHCGRFSFACLQKLFELCHVESEATKLSSKIFVSRTAVSVLTVRCKSILCKFRADEVEIGEAQLPQMRIDELNLVLQELAQLVLHPLTAAGLQIPISRTELSKSGQSSPEIQNGQPIWTRGHLLLLFTPLCELVGSRVTGVSNLLLVLLRIVGKDLGL